MAESHRRIEQRGRLTRAGTIALRTILFLLVMLSLLSAPILLDREGESVRFRVEAPVEVGRQIAEELVHGEAFVYRAGTMDRSALIEAPRYARNSFVTLFVSSVFSVIVALLTVLTLGARVSRWADIVLRSLNVFPVFVLALFAQTIVAQVYQRTGFRIALIGFHGLRSLGLPIAILALSGAGFLSGLLRVSIREIHLSDYMQLARAKGLSPASIVIRHEYAGLSHDLRAHLRGFLTFQLTGLFVVERIFSLPGLTRLLFDYAFQSTVLRGTYVRMYQPDMVLLASLLIFAMSMLSYRLLRLLLAGGKLTLLSLPVRPGSGTGRHTARRRRGKTVRARTLVIGGGVFLAALLLLGAIGPAIAPYDFESHETFVRVSEPDGSESLYVSPVPPLPSHRFGTTATGRDLLTLMLYGLRYTLLTAGVAATAGVACAIGLAVVVAGGSRTSARRASIAGAIPPFLVAYFLLVAISIDPPFAPPVIALLQAVILAAVSIPRLLVSITTRVTQINRLPYIEAAVSSGGSRRWVMWKHVLPALRSEIVLLWGQELVRMLGLFGFLALFDLYIGGTGVTIYPTLHFSLVYDWAGLVGGNIGHIYSANWLLLIPLSGYMLVVASATVFAQGLSNLDSRSDSEGRS